MSFIDYLTNKKEIKEAGNVGWVRTDVAKELTDPTDGPVTPFVAIARAIEIARKNKYPLVGIDDPIANALYEVLTEGFNINMSVDEIPSNEMPPGV